MNAGLTLTAEEIREVTGYARPADQVAELQRLGFTRARRCRVTGRAVLERTHYESVAAGQLADRRPQVRPPKLRAVGAA